MAYIQQQQQQQTPGETAGDQVDRFSIPATTAPSQSTTTTNSLATASEAAPPSAAASTTSSSSNAASTTMTLGPVTNSLVTSAPGLAQSSVTTVVASPPQSHALQHHHQTPHQHKQHPNSYKYPQLRQYFEFGPWVGRNRKALCLACHMQSSSSQPDRLLKHLNRCNALTDTDKAEVAVLMNERTANKRKPPSGVRVKRDYDNDSEFFAEDEPNTGLEDDMTLSSVNASHHAISTPNSAAKRVKREHSDRNTQVDQALTKFVMVCRIPLKAIHSKEFIDLVRALDPDYHIPSRETITNVLIPGMLNII